MAAASPTEPAEFIFDATTVQRHDIYYLDHADEASASRVVIVITHVTDRVIMGMATDSDGLWYAHLGPIIFRRPIRLGEPTDAVFEHQRTHEVPLQICPTRLDRVRDGKLVHLLT